jgi:wyosine [tRNA(Phe)-imidazoG37] synthetase (radical SAM superfamily)
MSPFYLLWSDERGEIRESSRHLAVGRTASSMVRLTEDQMMPLPSGSTLHLLPGRRPLGISVESGKSGTFHLQRKTGFRGEYCAVAAILPPGYLRTLLPAWKKSGGGYLPFNAYAAVGFREGQIWAAARPLDETVRWSWSQYDSPALSLKIREVLKKFRGNRIIAHLSRCATEFHCYTAQNIFMNRWEGALPSSPSCNASCIGCISRQSEPAVPRSPQERINFVPSPEEIAELGVHHLAGSEWSIASFGQGCEGEPLLQAGILSGAIFKIRNRTGRGTLNMNTNGSLPRDLDLLLDSGLDSIRVSLNSAIEANYLRYFRPSGYTFGDVMKSLKTARERKAFISLNLLVFPGITDGKNEINALEELIHKFKIDMIQMRNMNIDPDLFMDEMHPVQAGGRGLASMLDSLKENFPALKIGTCTPPLRI